MDKKKVQVREPLTPEMLRLLEEDPRAYFSRKPRVPFGFVAPEKKKED